MIRVSIFDFLKEDKQFSEVYDDCMEMEKLIIYNIPRYSIACSRTILEKLLRIIINNEFPSLDKQLIFEEKNNERTSNFELIEDVYAEGLISYKIYDEYHNIRKIGNRAAHGKGNFTIYDSKGVHKVIFYLILDCFKRYNKIEGIEYKFILDDAKPGFDITGEYVNFLLRDIDLSQYKEYIVNYCKENILYDLLEKKITEREVKTRFDYYVAIKNQEARNLKTHSDLYYDPSKPEIESYLSKKEKLDVYEKVKDIICDGFTEDVYDLLVKEMTKVIKKNQAEANDEFEKYDFARLVDLTCLEGDEIENYIKQVLSFIEENKLKAEHINDTFIIKTAYEYHLYGKINVYDMTSYANITIDDLLKDIDLSQYDENIVKKCKDNLLKDYLEEKITEDEVIIRFKYCVSPQERIKQNLTELINFYHNPTEPSNEILLSPDEKTEVYKKVEDIINEGYSGSVLELLVNEIDLYIDEKKNKTKNQLKEFINSITDFTEFTGLVGIEIDDYINEFSSLIDSIGINSEHLSVDLIKNTGKDYNINGRIDKRKLINCISNDEPYEIVDFSSDDVVDGSGFDSGSDDVVDISEDESKDENPNKEELIEEIPLFKKENREELLSLTGLKYEEVDEFIDEIISSIGKYLPLENITEEFIRRTGRDYHLFGIIDLAMKE